MATWNSRGLRGSSLEELINLTNEKYRAGKIALIQKIPTPIKPVRMDTAHRQITLAYLNSAVPSIISALFREFRSVLMPKNVRHRLFRYKIFMNIRLFLWRILNVRAVLLF